jgi:signal transduction histidine kinase
LEEVAMGYSAVPAVLFGEGQPPGFPFRGPVLGARVIPFAVVAVLAEISLALPPGVQSRAAMVASIVLLLAVAASFALPWSRLPAWVTVLVPLACTGWVLTLILAAGVTSGVGIVILIPLIWTALFHRRWESACIVAAIVAVQVITSLVPVAADDSVIIRRVLLWGLLGALLSVAAHGLRDRIARSQREAALLEEQLREATVWRDRDRIAAGLQNEVIQRIFAAGMNMESAASLTTQPGVRQRLEAATADLDHALRLIRDTVFGLEQRLQGRGLRQEILELSGGLSPEPEVSFTGPVDGALEPGGGTQLVAMLREALAVIAQDAVLASIGVTADEAACTTVIEARLTHAAGAGWAARQSPGLREQAARAGASVDIEPGPDGVRFAWRLPLIPAGAPGPQR